ncbi:NADP-dependent oxidoreductase [Microbacterium excoecariae]|uniref:NADP-dependent oxidoreductase n=1 Tax=Microbacterium excoecariae TaxID=2715210 RepID=UPI00140C2554|nr:NADP-dependent oxidoreductase [Microbacterium excoecariae]NHI17538.1 NADP-dependent oxidoreductase [Microbacterium excoecariae]
MKAVVLKAFGEQPVLADVEVPVPGPGEVRVRVKAASVNGFDVAVANGYLRGVMEHRFPVVLGKDFAGDVEALGEGVTEFAVGDKVFGVVNKPDLGDGSFGEYVTVPVAVGVARIPDGVTYEEAAALGLAGTAAVDAFDASGSGEGHTVLVAGATGGVGQQAVQLAAGAGAKVIATAGSDEGRAKVSALGAASTIDYAGDIVEQVRAAHPDGVDAVLHFAGDPVELGAVLKPGGVLVSTLVMDPSQLQLDDVQIVPIFAQSTGATLERIARNHVDGVTGVTVQRVYSLEEAPLALTDFTRGTLGKLVVAVS